MKSICSIFKIALFALSCLLVTAVFGKPLATGYNDTLREGYGKFIFKYNPLPDKPVNVYYYKPEGLPENAPVMILMHGTLRNATTYRKNMAKFAKKYRFLLIVPEFSKDEFPHSREYHQGGVFEKDKTMRSREKWTFSMIEPLFDFVKQKSGNTSSGYILYGFSAGSQFIHRFTWFVPENRALKTVSSSAGSYTMPDFKINYPYGLKSTGITLESVAKSFAKDVTIDVGLADTVLSDKYLPKSKMAEKQGSTRVERAKAFYESCKRMAEKNGFPFNWKLMLVPDVAHDNGKMDGPVTEMLFQEKEQHVYKTK